MGRFETTVEFYARYREPYSSQFFSTIAERLPLDRTQSLLDVGCGPGLLAVGLARYVATVTAIDPEPAMVAAAQEKTAQSSVRADVTLATFEEFAPDRTFDVIAIGRALHWLDKEQAMQKLKQLLSPGGRILICSAAVQASEQSPWLATYNDLRRMWAEVDDTHARSDGPTWFANSPFRFIEDITCTELREVTVAELIGRSLSRSNTSPAVLGDRRSDFENEIHAALDSYEREGKLREQILCRASVFELAPTGVA